MQIVFFKGVVLIDDGVTIKQSSWVNTLHYNRHNYYTNGVWTNNDNNLHRL